MVLVYLYLLLVLLLPLIEKTWSHFILIIQIY